MRRIAVFCGSSPGVRGEYADAAHELGERLAAAGLGLVYGGGATGLMGSVSAAALAGGAEVIGVIPEFMVQREWGRTELVDLRVVATMHERKALMYDLADGFVVLPGGLGTWDEFFEVAAWRQLGLHDKPIVLLSPAGFHEPLTDLLLAGLEEGFVSREGFGCVTLAETLDEVFEALR